MVDITKKAGFGGSKLRRPDLPRQRLLGITPLKRKSKEVYQIAFSYQGVQCREIIVIGHSKVSELYCSKLRAEIQRKISINAFRYDDYFPNSSRAKQFGGKSVSKKTIKDALGAYLNRVEKTIERSSFVSYRNAVNNFLIRDFGNVRVDQLSPADIRNWMATQTVKLKTLRNRLLPLRAILNEAVADNVIAYSPLDRVELAKQVSPAQRGSDFEARPYTETQLLQLLSQLDGAERYVFQAWADTGLRTGELIGLRWARVDFEAKTVSVEETTTARLDKPRPKTKAGRRAIPLLPAALEAYELQRQFTLLSNDRVFQNQRARVADKQWDEKSLAAVWRRAHKDTGIEYRNPYQLRHTFASNLLSQGENIALIAKLLGHKTIEVSMKTYAKWVTQGQLLSFDRPPRSFGMNRLWLRNTEEAKR
ncbi:site-specific integrase [soil metagenome]